MHVSLNGPSAIIVDSNGIYASLDGQSTIVCTNGMLVWMVHLL